MSSEQTQFVTLIQEGSNQYTAVDDIATYAIHSQVINDVIPFEAPLLGRNSFLELPTGEKPTIYSSLPCCHTWLHSKAVYFTIFHWTLVSYRPRSVAFTPYGCFLSVPFKEK